MSGSVCTFTVACWQSSSEVCQKINCCGISLSQEAEKYRRNKHNSIFRACLENTQTPRPNIRKEEVEVRMYNSKNELQHADVWRLVSRGVGALPVQLWHFQPPFTGHDYLLNMLVSLFLRLLQRIERRWECGCVDAGQNKDHCPPIKLVLRQQNTFESAWIKKQSGSSYGASDLFKWSVGVLRVSAQPIKLRKHGH